MVFADRNGRCFVIRRTDLKERLRWCTEYLPEQVSEYVCDQLGIICGNSGHLSNSGSYVKQSKTMENRIRKAIRLLRSANLTNEQKREFSLLATELGLTVRDVTEHCEELVDNEDAKPHYINE